MTTVYDETPSHGMELPLVLPEDVPRRGARVFGAVARRFTQNSVEIEDFIPEWPEVIDGREALLLGTLPTHQHNKISEFGYTDYFLGSTQIGAFTGEQLVTHMALNKGVALEYDLPTQFLHFDHTFLKREDKTLQGRVVDAVDEGNYGNITGGIRVIAAFPLTQRLRQDHDGTYDGILHRYYGTQLPSDLVKINGSNGFCEANRAINERYIAGYVGLNGTYHTNPTFMQYLV